MEAALLSDEAGLKVAVRFDDGAAVIVLAGELDLRSRTALVGWLQDVLSGRPERLVLDVSEVTYLDCGTAEALADLSSFLPAGSLPVLRSPMPAVLKLLMVSELDAHFEIEP
jgi:anti-anti-sigma factor